MPKQVKRVPVSIRAVIQRINRKLAPVDEQLKTSRSERFRQELGDFYIVNLRLNAVTRMGVALEKLGRELDALKEWETIADND